MIGIRYIDYLKYGCPECGCSDYNILDDSSMEYKIVRCKECDNMYRIHISSEVVVGINHLKISKHPRINIPWHPLIK